MNTKRKAEPEPKAQPGSENSIKALTSKLVEAPITEEGQREYQEFLDNKVAEYQIDRSLIELALDNGVSIQTILACQQADIPIDILLNVSTGKSLPTLLEEGAEESLRASDLKQLLKQSLALS